MRMRETGLMSQWYKENSPNVQQCVTDKTKGEPDVIAPLSILHLSFAFAVLAIGYVAALIFFFIEIKACYWIAHNKKN